MKCLHGGFGMISKYVLLLSRLIFFLILLFITPSIILAAPIETVINTNDAGPGSLRQAILDVDSGGEIVFDLPDGPQTLTLTSTLTIDKSLTITGPGTKFGIQLLTVTSGGGVFEVFSVDDGDEPTLLQVVISGLTADLSFAFLPVITNRENLTLNDVVVTAGFIGITNASSITAAGTQSILTINNSLIEGNISTGIFNQGAQDVSGTSGNVEINNTTIRGNFEFGVFHAGSVYDFVSCGTFTINNSTISGNLQGALNDGGNGPNSIGCTMIINNSTIVNNGGDGIQNNGGTDPTGTGGMLTVNYSTISGNGFNGIINFDLGNGNFSTADVNNSIIANSGLEDCASGGLGVLIGTGANFDTDGTCAAFSPSFTQVTPMQLNLGPLQNNGGPTDTVALIPPSIAIDSVIGCPPPTTDQRGFPRPFGSGCDSGAFEDQPTASIKIIKETTPQHAKNISFATAGFPVGDSLNGGFTLDDGEMITSGIISAVGPTYFVWETPLQPFNLLDVSCIGNSNPLLPAGVLPGVGITPAPNESIKCTFLNEVLPLNYFGVIPEAAGSVNHILFDGAQPDEEVAIVWGFSPGTTLIGSGQCTGSVLGIKNPKLLTITLADLNGNVNFPVFVPLSAIGITVVIQSVALENCRTSNTGTATFSDDN